MSELFLCCEQRIADIVQGLKRIDETLLELGATLDYLGTVIFIVGMITTWIVLTFVLNSLEMIWLVSFVPFEVVSVIVTIAHLPIHINSMISYNFSIVVW